MRFFLLNIYCGLLLIQPGNGDMWYGLCQERANWGKLTKAGKGKMQGSVSEFPEETCFYIKQFHFFKGWINFCRSGAGMGV